MGKIEGGDVRVGVAGWSIPSGYKQDLPGAGSHLERYAARLSAVEINSSFHRHHRAQTYERWAASVPANFRFAVKTPRAFTHEGEFVADTEVLVQFAEEIAGLCEKLSVILVQLPPKLAFDAPATRRFVKAMRKRIDAHYVCEPRHPSWASQQVWAIFDNMAHGHGLGNALTVSQAMSTNKVARRRKRA